MSKRSRVNKINLVVLCILIATALMLFIGIANTEELPSNKKQEPISFNQAVRKEKKSSDFEISIEDRNLLARLVFLEAGICSFDCKCYVASVVVNRLKSKKWGKTLRGVIYYPGQFVPAPSLNNTIPYRCGNTEYQNSKEFIQNWDDCFRAVDRVILDGSCLPEYVYYFSNDFIFDWPGYVVFVSKDNMFFGYLTEDKKEDVF